MHTMIVLLILSLIGLGVRAGHSSLAGEVVESALAALGLIAGVLGTALKHVTN